MSETREKVPNTKMRIIQTAARMFITEGYSKSSVGKIAKELDVSLGNITFYFPTKDYMLAELAKELFAFQKIVMDQEVSEGKTSLLAYCLELTAIAAVCEESEIARDLYGSIYGSALTLGLLRANDLKKTREVFSEFRPDWSDLEWEETENIVSGIEYATVMTREENVPLPMQIEKTLDIILYLYGVPEELRKEKIKKVVSMDYKALGHRVLVDFMKYIEDVNEENLKNAPRKHKNIRRIAREEREKAKKM